MPMRGTVAMLGLFPSHFWRSAPLFKPSCPCLKNPIKSESAKRYL